MQVLLNGKACPNWNVGGAGVSLGRALDRTARGFVGVRLCVAKYLCANSLKPEKRSGGVAKDSPRLTPAPVAGER